MNEAQRAALTALCGRYNVPFSESDFRAAFDLPAGYVAGWVYDTHHAGIIYVGVDPEGRISS